MVVRTEVKPEVANPEGEEEVVPGPDQVSVLEPTSPQLTAEELQAQLATVKSELATTKAGLSGKDRENARLRTRLENLEGLQERLETAIDQRFLSFGELILGEEGEPEVEPPTRLQRLRQGFGPRPKAPPQPAPATTEMPPEVVKLAGKMEAVLEHAGFKPNFASLPPDLQEALGGAVKMWQEGRTLADLEAAHEEVKKVVANYKKAQTVQTEEERKRAARAMGDFGGSSRGTASSTFTSQQIAAMSPAEYKEKLPAIEKAQREGKIKE